MRPYLGCFVAYLLYTVGMLRVWTVLVTVDNV